MASFTPQSDQIIREAGQSLARQRAGGRRRSIGRASAKLKVRHFGRKLRNAAIGVGAIFLAAFGIGLLVDGIGMMGLLATLILAFIATIILLRYPAMQMPQRADLATDNVRQLVGRTELWLEAQRPALPPPAAKLVNVIGVQLDELQVQLEQVDQSHPTAEQIRKLVGVDLPDMIEGYQRIPERLRHEEHSGTTPARQLLDGLGVIEREIDSINRQLAQGSLDDLAIRTRYLDYKYPTGEGPA